MNGPSLSLRQAAREHGSELALIAAGNELSFAQLEPRVAAVWQALRRRGLQLGPGAAVALQAPNSVEALLVILALCESGTPLLPLHPRLTGSEVEVLVADAQPQAVLSAADLAALAAEPLTAAAQAAFAALPEPDPVQPLAILYTSGTSGRPKGAVLSRAAFVASAAASAHNLGWQPADRWLLCLPLCHVGGLSIVTRCLLARRALVLLARPEPAALRLAVAAHRVTLLSLVPTVLAALLDHLLAAPPVAPELHSLRAILLGGAATPEPLYERALAAGLPVLRTYGLTEACSQVTTARYAQRHKLQPGAGPPLPGLELVIGRDDESAVAGQALAAVSSLPLGTPGRIYLRGPMLMSGYLHGPALAGRYFDTGDLGFLDEGGALHVLARRSDLIVTGGENVYPAEVEAALLRCPGVAAALVFGVPDPHWGARVAAALVLTADALSQDWRQSILASLGPRLASFKRPRLWCQVAELPLLPNGKPDRCGAALRLAEQLRPVAAS